MASTDTSNAQLEKLSQRLETRQAQIAIIGAGYVGLPLGLRYAECGFAVWMIDVNVHHVALINAQKSYISTISEERLKNVNHKTFRATTDYAVIGECDAVIICVPTPLNRYREPDLKFVTDSVEQAAPYLKAGQIVSLESTTYPGTTEEEVKPRIEASGLKVGQDIFLVFSPEREDPGNANFHTANIPKVCGGSTPLCLRAGVKLYSPIIERVVEVSSTQTAELTKLLENIYRAVNIGLVNEMKIVADRMGIDIFEVISAAATKPFGFTPYYPGPGWGGHCIPVDPFYLTWKARQFGVSTKFIELAGEVNTAMPAWVVDKIADGLNGFEKSIRSSRILICGIAYKKNVNDMRESPAVQIMEILRSKGARVSYTDPFVPTFPKLREHKFELDSVPLTEENLKSFDCVVVVTNHDLFDYDLILRSAHLIVDTRGVYRQNFTNVIKA